MTNYFVSQQLRSQEFFEGEGPVVETKFVGIIPVYLEGCKNWVKKVLKLG